MKQRLACAGILAMVCMFASAQTPAPMSVQQILAHMSANTAGLTTYQVPLTIKVHVHKGLTVPLSLSGTRYFKMPDKEALHMRTVPAIAKPFQDAYADLGTPATWLQTYDITEVTPSIQDAQPVYELRGTYKKPSSHVDHILLDVDAATFDPVQARWFYTNGATIVMNIQEQPVDKYRLPSRETLDVAFPSYKGNAVVTYGTYIVNQDVPDSTFASSPSPSPL